MSTSDSKICTSFSAEDYILALTRVVANLAKRTTDESFTMKVVNVNGDHVWLNCDALADFVVWTKPGEAATLPASRPARPHAPD